MSRIRPEWIIFLGVIAALLMILVAGMMDAVIQDSVEAEPISAEEIAEQDVVHIVSYNDISPGPEIILSPGE